MKKKSFAGFTLIELLVVVAIIAVLIAILLPALTLAREQARRTACRSNLHQQMLAFLYYAEEYNRFPPTHPGGQGAPMSMFGGSVKAMMRYGLTLEILFCPSTRDYELRKSQGYLNVAAWVDSSEIPYGYVKPGGTDGWQATFMYTSPPQAPKPIPLRPTDPGDWIMAADLVYYCPITPDFYYVAPHLKSGLGSTATVITKSEVAGGNLSHADGAVLWKDLAAMTANYIFTYNDGSMVFNYW